MNKRNCECCKANYATGKSYGDYNCIIPDPNCETKGLCEFCNPNDKTWYMQNKECHKEVNE